MMSWILKGVGDYIRLCLFACGILLGVQIPGFIDQYQQRIDAHLLEAKQNLAGFKFTADRYFNGSIEQLVAHYRASNDEVFVQDANSVAAIANRVELLEAEYQALQTHPVWRAWHVAVASNQPVLEETFSAFNFTVPLNLFALIWGASLGVLLIIILDLGYITLRRCVHSLKTRKN
jgi:hypothetical protein